MMVGLEVMHQFSATTMSLHCRVVTHLCECLALEVGVRVEGECHDSNVCGCRIRRREAVDVAAWPCMKLTHSHESSQSKHKIKQSRRDPYQV